MKHFSTIFCIFLFQLSILILNASPNVICNVSVGTNTIGTIQINGLEGTNINAKVFDESWNLIWECNDWGTPCQTTELIAGLESGQYRVSVESSLCQFYEQVEVLESGVEESCGWQNNYDVFGNFASLETAVEGNEDFTLSYFDDNPYPTEDSLLHLTFDLVGNLQNYDAEIYPPTTSEEFGYEVISASDVELQRFDNQGNVLWSTLVSLDYAGELINIADHFHDNGFVYFVGAIKYIPEEEKRFFMLKLDENGNLLEEKYATELYYDYLYSTTSLKAIIDHDVILLQRQGQGSTMDLVGFNYEAELLYTTEWFNLGHWNEGRWFNNDGSIMYDTRRFEVVGSFSGFNTLTGEFINLEVEDGYGLFKYGMIPTEDNGMIFSYINTSATWGPLGAAGYGKLDNDGNIVWSYDSFPGWPALKLADGSLIFSDYYYDYEYLTVTKTNSVGEIIYCDCAVEVNVREGRIDVEKLQGEAVSVNVLDENESVVWSCNHWSGNTCEENFSIDLPEGQYSVAIQSEKCDIFEEIEMVNTFVDEACVSNYPYDFHYSVSQLNVNGLQDISLTNDGLQLLMQDETQNCLQLSVDNDGNQIDTDPLTCPEITFSGWMQSIDPTGNTSIVSLTKMENDIPILELTYQFPSGTDIQSYAAKAFEDHQGNFVLNGLIFSSIPSDNRVEFIPYFLTIDNNGNTIDLIYGEPFEVYNPYLVSYEQFVIDELNEIFVFTASNQTSPVICGYDFEGNQLWRRSMSGSRLLFIKHGRVMSQRTGFFQDPFFVNTTLTEDLTFATKVGPTLANRYFPELEYEFTVVPNLGIAYYPGLNGNIVWTVTSAGVIVELEHVYFMEFNSEGALLWMRAFEPGFQLRSTLENGDHIFVRYNETSIDLIRLNSIGEVVGCETTAAPTECVITLTPEDGQLTIDGLVGNELNVNVFDDAFNLVWSCNFWSDNCAEVEVIENLSGGNYYVAAQSDLCDFYEMVNVPAPRNAAVRSAFPATNDAESTMTITSIYPNPVKDQLFLELFAVEEGSTIVQINDSQGKQVEYRRHQLENGTNKLNINTSHFQKGLYYVTVIGNSGTLTVGKFVKD